MKKKIIKSYFFNIRTNYNSPLFVFSKRAVKLRKYDKIRILTSKKAINHKIYKLYLIDKHLNKQWYNKVKPLKSFFLKSFYFNKLRKKKTRKWSFFYWYKLKFLMLRDNYKRTQSYPLTGFLSSHFVHFLSRKNISYQSRSKFKKHINNLSTLYFYISAYSNFLNYYIQNVNKQLYFFTTNSSKPKLFTDSEVNKITNDWINIENNLNLSGLEQTPNYININLEYNIKDLDTLLINKDKLLKIYLNFDQKQLDDLKSTLNNKTIDILQNINLYNIESKKNIPIDGEIFFLKSYWVIYNFNLNK